MGGNAELESLEREAYRASYSDGIIDLYAGLSAMWIGIAWIWLSDIAGIAGVLPAIFVAPVLSGHKRFVESRLGYVAWRAPRRRWERRNLWALLAIGIGFFVVGVAVFLLFADGSASDRGLALAPAILAWLLAIMAVGLAFLMSAPRMLGYAAVLGVTGLVTALATANPGWPLLISGVVIAVTGAVMLGAFVRRYPRLEE